ncbi:hypothetical protein RND71_025071 [Anisodus tanguticus]|uniref:Uncharacterized protein n=1 Tax=Anisodus tanguticus TaxID=243964 RepID=A0AAE1RQZ4_9SOLA|nr:hypothetical protein RND71_025071 [Anisodus tanguticus]
MGFISFSDSSSTSSSPPALSVLLAPTRVMAMPHCLPYAGAWLICLAREASFLDEPLQPAFAQFHFGFFISHANPSSFLNIQLHSLTIYTSLYCKKGGIGIVIALEYSDNRKKDGINKIETIVTQANQNSEQPNSFPKKWWKSTVRTKLEANRVRYYD